MTPELPGWMLEAPQVKLSEDAVTAFERAWEARDTSLLPAGVPRWLFLRWLAGQGYLLHGSPRADLLRVEAQPKAYHQPDEFSNTQGVYATPDALWAMMYALRGPDASQQSDMCLQVRQGDTWTAPRYFYSLAPADPGVTDVRRLLAPGTVYVLSQTGFQSSLAYDHPGLGHVQEAHFVHPGPLTPLWALSVRPADFPLPVHLHDADTVRQRSRAAPWAFPWLDD